MAACCLSGTPSPGPVSGDDVLAKAADTTNQGLAVPYSGLREYTLHNLRFGKQARVSVRMQYRPSEGKTFNIVERSGNSMLTGIIDRILESETAESRLPKGSTHELGPANYWTDLRRTEAVSGRPCYAVELKPKRKNKYLIQGTLWVDTENFALVKLEGSTATNVSMWVGTPQITEEFRQIGGISLPVFIHSIATSMWLGTSELEIHFSDYRVGESNRDFGSTTPHREGASASRAGSPEASVKHAGRAAFAFTVTPKSTTGCPRSKSLTM